MFDKLSSRERGQWYLHQIAGHTGICNIGISCHFEHRLRKDAAQEALQWLAARHPALRQNFPEIEGKPTRHHADPDEFAMPFDTVEADGNDLDAALTEITARQFDIERGPLVSAICVQAVSHDVLIIAGHHIVVDGWSMSILADEFCQYYHYLTDGQDLAPGLMVAAPQFEAPGVAAEVIRSWADGLTGIKPEEMMLDGACSISGPPGLRAGHVSVCVSEKTRGRMNELRKDVKASDGVVALAASAVLLHRHGAGDDIVIGVPVNLRRDPSVAGAVGFHVATVPLRFRFGKATSFRQVANQARSAVVKVLTETPASVEEILDYLGHRSADWRVPLFRHLVNVQPFSVESRPEVREFRIHRAGCRSDLELWGMSPGGSPVHASFNTEVHNRADVDALIRRFEPLIRSATAAPDVPVADLDIFSADDHQIMSLVSGGEELLPSKSILHYVHAVPDDRCAIIDGGRSWSYGHLTATAGSVAERLRRQGIHHGQRVGVVGHRSAELAAAVLGIWECGAAYVPIDPSLPLPLAIGELDGAAGLIIGRETLPAGATAGIPFVLAVEDTEHVQQQPLRRWNTRPEDAAVIIHTSGTTGRPKGVVINHRAMLNVVGYFAKYLEADENDRMLWSSTFGFDVSGLELFLPLMVGGTTVVADDETRSRPERLLGLIDREKIGLVQATPTLWKELVRKAPPGVLKSVRALSVGEPLTAPLARQILDTGCQLFNGYGPSETTILSTVAKINKPVDQPVSIGRPIANTVVEIRDTDGRLCPPGVVGEMWIGGVGLADCYLGQPELTRERFVGAGSARRYRTGDLAHWDAAKSLILHGRSDRQVKLRGIRVELSGIEAILQQHPHVRSATVCLAPGPHAAEIVVAAVQFDDQVPQAPEKTFMTTLWDYLRQALPAHEIPGRIVPLENLPLTSSGKLNRDELLTMVTRQSRQTVIYNRPRSSLVDGLVEIWCELLESQGLTEYDNFFLNGGNSLMAAQLIERVKSQFRLQMDYRALFNAPTPMELAEDLQRNNRSFSDRPARA